MRTRWWRRFLIHQHHLLKYHRSQFFLVLISITIVTARVFWTGPKQTGWKSDAQQMRRKQTAICATLYIVSFMSSWVLLLPFAIVAGAVEEKVTLGIFAFALILKMIMPLQGFWTCFIYFRPKFSEFRSTFPHLSRLDAFWGAVQGEVLGCKLPNERGRRSSTFSATRKRSSLQGHGVQLQDSCLDEYQQPQIQGVGNREQCDPMSS